MATTMRECWHQNPSARLSALRIKKNLKKYAAAAGDVRLNHEGEVYV